jgi:signal peptidase I
MTTPIDETVPAPTPDKGPEKKPRRFRQTLRSALGTAAILLVPFAARASFVDHYKVPSGSMLPTVEIGDRVFVNKAAFGLRLPLAASYLVETTDPAHGDVVVLRSPEDASVVLLKRVIAVPGDVVEVRGGHVYLDGEMAPVSTQGDALIETLGSHAHELQLTRGGGPSYGPLTLPPRKFLVMGDNRGDSRDGRSFGLVERDAFLGAAKGVVLRKGRFTWRSL